MRKWLILPAVLAFFVIAYWADSETMPGWLKMLYDFPNGDRVGHVVIYATIALVFNIALPGRGWKLAPLGSLIALGMATLEEASQFFFPSRTPDWVDLACGFIGIVLATALTIFIAKRKQNRPLV
jgi:VanZ family protein